MKTLFEKYKQVFLYLFFGATTTAVNWLIYTPLQALVGMTAANGLAWLGAVLYAFFTNRRFVFQSHSDNLIGEGLRFFASRILSGLLEVFLPTALCAIGLDMPLFGIPGGVAKALVSVLVIVMNFIAGKFIVFRNSPGKPGY